MPERPCRRCIDENVMPPAERTQQPSGAWSVYCPTHTRVYQKERRDAKRILLAPSAEKTDVQRAVEILTPKQPGRKPGDNMCPECRAEPRANGSSYCTECTKAYRKNKDERAKARLLEEMAAEATAQREYQEQVRPRYTETHPALTPPSDMDAPTEMEPLYKQTFWKEDEPVPPLGPPKQGSVPFDIDPDDEEMYAAFEAEIEAHQKRKP